MTNKHLFIDAGTDQVFKLAYTCPAGYQAIVVDMYPYSTPGSAYFRVNNGTNIYPWQSFSTGSDITSKKILLEPGNTLYTYNVNFSIVETPLSSGTSSGGSTSSGNFLSIPDFNSKKAPDVAPYYPFSLSMPTTAYWGDIAFGNGIFVAIQNSYDGYNSNVGTNSQVAISYDGLSWELKNLPIGQYFGSIAFGNGIFVIVPRTAAVSSVKSLISSDGINWTNVTLPEGRYWSDVTFGNGMFVAVSGLYDANYSSCYTSTDGLTWTVRNLPGSSYTQRVAFGNGKFVMALGRSTTTSSYSYTYVSSDGINWEQKSLPVSGSWGSVTFGNGKFVMINCAYYATNTGTNQVVYSTDGNTWTAATMVDSSDNYINEVFFGNGIFLATTGKSGYNQTELYSSVNGITWTRNSSALPSNRWGAAIYANGLWVAIAGGDSNASTNVMRVSFDNGSTWLQSGYSSNRANKVYYLNNKSILVSSDDMLTSTSLLTDAISRLSVPNISSVKFFNNKYYATRIGSNLLYTSTDAVTWSTVTLPTTANWVDIDFDGTSFVIIADSSAVAYKSTDGTTWTSTSLGSSQKWSSISSLNGIFTIIAFGSTVKLASSDNGATWTSTSLYESVYKIYKLQNSLVMPIKGSTTAYVSNNGSTWNNTVLPNAVFKLYDHGNTLILEDIAKNLYTTTDGFIWKSYKTLNESTMPTKIREDGSLEVYNTANSSFLLI